MKRSKELPNLKQNYRIDWTFWLGNRPIRSLNCMNDAGLVNTKVTGQIMYKGVEQQHKEVDVYEMRKRSSNGFSTSKSFSKSIYDNIAFALRVAARKEQEEIRRSLKQV